MKKFIFAIILFVLFIPSTMTFAKGGLELKTVFTDEYIKDNELTSIAWNKANTYVAGGSNLLYVSKDGGRTWDKVSLPLRDIDSEDGFYIYRILWDGKQFIAADSHGVFVSKDGLEWVKVFNTTSSVSYRWNMIEKVNGRFVAYVIKFVTKNGLTREYRSILESSDLRHWKEIKTVIDKDLNADGQFEASLKEDEMIYTIATNGKITVLGGHHGRIIYSNQKKQWVERPLTNGFPDDDERNGSINKIYWNGKEFIAMVNTVYSSKSAIYSSVDGKMWRKYTKLPPLTEVYNIIPTDIGNFVIGPAFLKNSNYAPSSLSFSTNNKNWNTHMFPTQKYDAINNAVWNGNELIGVGTNIYQVKLTPEIMYADFKKGQYWSEDMIWAIDNNLISGYKKARNSGAGTGRLLKPYTTLTEAQALTVLYRYFDPEKLMTNDTSSSWWAAKAYLQAISDGLQPKGGITNTSVADSGISRETFAKFLASKHFGKAVSIEEAVAFMYKAGITTGYSDKSGQTPMTLESFGREKLLNRSQIVTFMIRYHDYSSKLQNE